MWGGIVVTRLSGVVLENDFLFCSTVCMRRETALRRLISCVLSIIFYGLVRHGRDVPVRANWPTVAMKPARKAL